MNLIGLEVVGIALVLFVQLLQHGEVCALGEGGKGLRYEFSQQKKKKKKHFNPYTNVADLTGTDIRSHNVHSFVFNLSFLYNNTNGLLKNVLCNEF